VFTFATALVPLIERRAIESESEVADVVQRVVVMLQENHTTGSYFRGTAPFGAAAVSDWPLSPNPPASDPPHDRRAYFDWLTGAFTGDHVQFAHGRCCPTTFTSP
jgi:hypothetical protein